MIWVRVKTNDDQIRLTVFCGIFERLLKEAAFCYLESISAIKKAVAGKRGNAK